MGRVAESPFAMPACVPFLERLSDAVRLQVTTNSRKVRYPPATMAWEQGEPMQSAILISGLARAFISSATGRQATVRYVHPGELMGAAVLAGLEFPGAVQIVVGGVLQYLDIGLFQTLFRTKQELAVALANELAARYIHATQSATILVFGTTVQKVAYDLLERACREQLSTGKLVIGVTHQELADSVNSSREVVSRAMASLRRLAIIKSSTGRTTILDPARLEATAWHGL